MLNAPPYQLGVLSHHRRTPCSKLTQTGLFSALRAQRPRGSQTACEGTADIKHQPKTLFCHYLLSSLRDTQGEWGDRWQENGGEWGVDQKRMSGISVGFHKRDSAFVCVDRSTHVEGKAGDYDSETIQTEATATVSSDSAWHKPDSNQKLFRAEIWLVTQIKTNWVWKSTSSKTQMSERCSRSKGSEKRQALQRSIRRPLCLPHMLFLLWVYPTSTGLPLAGEMRFTSS